MRKLRSIGLLGFAALGLTACGTTGAALTNTNFSTRAASLPPASTRPAPTVTGVGKVGRPYEINGIWYTPKYQPEYDETGLASWYGEAFDGKPTATGEAFDMMALSAAHKTLPLPSLVEVTNLDNGKSITLRVNDRGPFVDGRIIDLSKGAAEELGMLRAGVAKVRVRYVGPVLQGPEAKTMLARAEAPPSIPPRPGQAFEVQAGFFSVRANAERAAEMVAGAGATDVRPVDRDGMTYWRVVVGGLSSPDEAAMVRQQVVNSGFPDARIAGPF